MEKIKSALEGTIEEGLKNLQTVSFGSKEYADGAAALSELISKRNDMEKINIEIQSIQDKKEIEELVNSTNVKIKAIEFGGNILKTGLNVLAFGTITYGVMKFEETNVVRSKVWAWVPKLLNL